MKYNTFLFDFDGTLVDSMPAFISVTLNILGENGIVCGNDFVKNITPLGYNGTAEHMVKMGVPLSQDKLQSQLISCMINEYAFRIPAKNNVINTLSEMKAEGCQLNVLTASPHCVLDPCLKRLGLWTLFDHVFSCEDFGTTKTDPSIYHMVAKQLGSSVENILFLDDNYFSCLTANTAGMAVCGVFDSSSEEYEADIRAIADHYIRDFSELLRIVSL